ncbi:DNA polymerase alpha catalytic subunit A [Monosporozyma unispora]
MGSNDRLEKLKKLQAAKNGYTSNDHDDQDDHQIYDEIDEVEYKKRKRQELLQDDFVIDDDGVGYVDRGVEDEEPYYSSDNEDFTTSKKENKSKKKDVNAISQMLRLQQQQRKKTVAKSIVTKKTIAIDDFDDILGEFDKVAPTATTMTKSIKLPSSPTTNFKRKSNEPNSSLTNIIKKQKIDDDSLNIPQDIELDSSPLKNRQSNHSKKDSTSQPDDLSNLMNDIDNSPITSPLKSKQPPVEMVDNESDIDDDDDLVFKRRPMRSVNTSRKVNFNSKTNPATSPFVTAPGTPVGSSQINKTTTTPSSKPLHYSINEPLSFSNKYNKEQIIDPTTDSFQFYWLDFVEVNNTLILFGKVKTLDNNTISAMIQINGLCRELYFLPRDGKTSMEVYDEITPLLMDKYGLSNIRAKPETMKYAFELPDIPHETEYLKVLLPFNTPKSSYDTIPPDLSSETFGHVFGGNTNIFEAFVVQNKIMGPCWLEIKNGDFNALTNASHCSVEVAVESPNDIKSVDIKTVPNLNCMSISIQTMMNPKENKQEIIAITLTKYNNILLDSPIPEDLKPNQITTLVRPPKGTSFPVGLATLAKQKLTGDLRLFNNEKTLLSCFCAMLKTSDPDVLIGHRLERVYLDILVHRIHDLNIPAFSCLGRRVRKQWPDKFGKSHSPMNQFFIRDLIAGRLICDIADEMGQSLTPKCQSWELSEMYGITCGKQHKALDVNYANERFQEDSNTMNLALQENITNSIIAAEVSFRIQMLSLTKQLTNLAGNAWSQTLGGTRAGRNEYILLHEFARNGFIVPDKESKKMKEQRRQEQMAKTGETDSTTLNSSKKAKYQGGLVFEPEKGLHKNYVLVMDFNSLYPSIIQEYNICFTTVDRNPYDIDELPEVPSTDKYQGVLPRLLATLVERRREVKKIMKNEKDPHKYVQCDIRQQALKLTANSMYGCLGYVNSRFYAKPLAMLVTNKGREILMNTRQLAESMNLLVVYGDTDSVMIDTGCQSYEEAIKIGQNFKKLVNERYRLLEIDIDNVFKRLLLHAKKKYAALNVTLNKDGSEKVVLEVKGLDMKRREYCPLSKEVSTHVLDTILSDSDAETALQEIYAYLEDINSKMVKNEIRADKYKINTKLSKDPAAYPGGKTMPAVQVALRMRKAGRLVKAGTVITYVITKPKEEVKTASHPAERAYALNEVMARESGLVPDPDFYLEKQIFAPVERLLERIEGFDVVRLSEALGLDSRKYLRRYDDNGGPGVNDLQPLETTISDMERFKDATNLQLSCSNCMTTFPFGGIVASNHYQMSYNGVQCKRCDHIFSPLQLTCQLESTIRAHISLYYAGWLTCDDITCGNVTRQISVFGKRCLREGCTGVMNYRYTDKQLYNQLLYFESLFDCAKNKQQELKPLYHEGEPDFPKDKLADSSIMALTEQNRDLFNINRGVVGKYLNNCGRRYVDMGSIFDFMSNN